MPIIPWRPFWDLERWFEEWPEPSRKLPPFRTPRMDISETNKQVVAELELPGAKAEDIDVEIADNVLKVKAKTKKKKEEKKKGYYRKEISSGFYKRAVPLPVEVKDKKAKASYEEGVLTVTIPKKKPKKKGSKKETKIKVKKK